MGKSAIHVVSTATAAQSTIDAPREGWFAAGDSLAPDTRWKCKERINVRQNRAHVGVVEVPSTAMADADRRNDWPVVVRPLNDPEAYKRDRDYWMSRPPDERVEAVEILRRQFYGTITRLERVSRVFQRPPR